MDPAPEQTHFGEPARNALPPDRILMGIVQRLTSAALFALLNVFIKLAEEGGAHIGELLFFRQAAATVVVFMFVAAGPGVATLRTKRIGAHLLRTVVGLSAMFFVFTTVVLIPLAEAITLQFTLPVFATIMGGILLGEAIGWRRWGAVALGFVGVVIIAGPGSGHVSLLGLATGLIGSLLSATVSILLRQIGKTEAPATTVFYFSMLSVPPLLIFFVLQVAPHPAMTWFWLVSIGVTGGISQLFMTASLRNAPVSIVTPMDYTGLVWGAIVGWLVFQTLPAPATWIGAPIIAFSGLYTIYREHRRGRDRSLGPIGSE